MISRELDVCVTTMASVEGHELYLVSWMDLHVHERQRVACDTWMEVLGVITRVAWYSKGMFSKEVASDFLERLGVSGIEELEWTKEDS